MMDGFGIFGLMGFVMVCLVTDRVRRLERVLRENGIGSVRVAGLAEQLRKQVGQTVRLTLWSGDGDTTGMVCKVLDADEDWALVLADEGKKKEREILLRLDSVENIEVK